MKRFLLSLLLLLAAFFAYPQYAVFHENFDGSSGADSVTSVPSSAWALSGNLFVSPTKSDSAKVVLNDTSILITDAFSTSGKSFVLLEFDQICKVEFLDAAELFVSVNNGSTWTQITAPYYLGSGQFGNFNNRFTAASYAVDWAAANPYTLPQNSWWKHEMFNISSLAANATQVKIMFRLRDGNNNGAGNNYGWLLDNIKVSAAIGELIPPNISLLPPVLEDSVFSTGPFGITAQITDASGIDTAFLYYKRNNSAFDTLGMIHLFGNTYYAEIDTVPAFNIGDSVCYRIKAVDNSPMSNVSYYPSPNACVHFEIKNSPPPPGCTNPVDSFPFYESFDTSFTAGSGSPSSPGILGPGWSRNPTNGNVYMWIVNSGSTPSSGTGPSAGHGGSGNYLYTESSYGSSGSSANLIMPCIDITQLAAPFLKFYYYMDGSQIGELHVDIYYGGQWQNDIIPPIVGNRGAQWHKLNVNLSYYKSITQIRFRAVKGTGYQGDIAIDDVTIWEPPAYDVAALSIDAPSSPANTGLQDVKVSFQNMGSEILHKLTLNWEVNQQSQTPLVWNGTLMPGITADSITIGQYNFSSGPATIKFWSSLPNDSADVNPADDTTLTTVIACTGPVHGNFTVGGANPDFVTLNDALFAISNCGIDSPVVFNIAPGIYNEQLYIDSIAGASSINTVTFRSLTADSTSVTIQYSPSNMTDNYTVRLNGAKYINFEGITLKSLGQSYARVVVMENNSSFITIKNCNIEVATSISSLSGAVYAYNSKCENIRILNNNIRRGYYGLYFRSSVNNHARSNKIIGNNIQEYRTYGIYFQYQDSLEIMNNTLKNNDSTISYLNPVYLYYLGGKFNISNNDIEVYSQSGVTAVRLYYCNGSSQNRALVSNNMISCKRAVSSTVGSYTPVGLYCYNSNYVDFFHNTINIDSVASQTSRCFYIYMATNFRIRNNILSNQAGGYLYYTYSSVSFNQTDYNNLYSPGPKFAYRQGDVSSLAAWRAATGADQHSFSEKPTYKSSIDLHIKNGKMNSKVPYLQSVAFDIDGDPRDTIMAAVGADEKERVPVDVGVYSIVSPKAPLVQNDTVPVKLVVKNFGTDTLPAFSCSYSLNGLAATAINHQAGMLPGELDTLSFPDIVLSPALNNICAYTLLPADTNTFNDTLCENFYVTSLIDMGVTLLVNPDSGQCFSATEPINVKVKNYGHQAIQFANNPLTIHVSVSGVGSPKQFTRTLNSGTINPGQEWMVSVVNSFNMAATGTYVFNAWTSINGDGDPVNDSMQQKSIYVFSTITQLPYIQDFENFTPSSNTNDPGVPGEGWVPDNFNANNAWYVGTGPTYTNNTGPANDHTTGGPMGKYMYTEAKGYSSAYASLISPCIDLSSASHPVLRFWYHMYGSNISQLRVDVFAGGQWHYQVFRKFGQQQNSSTAPWKQAVVDLSQYSGVIRVRFSAMKSSGYASDVAIDDVEIFDPQQHDAGLASHFVLPSVGFANTGTQVPVKVTIQNLGLDTLYSMNIGYEAGNAIPVLETWSGVLLPFKSVDYEFNTKLTAPNGEVSICAFTKLNSDMNPQNDTACRSFTGLPSLPLPFSTDFEGKGYFVGDGGNMQWQRGKPNKNLFKSAHSPQNAWLTSLQSPYLNNSHDFLYTPYFDFTTVPNCTLSFYHRIDAEPGSDGGYIQYSTDQGQTWINLGYIGDPLSINWYSSNNNGQHMWSGTSPWVHSTYDLSGFSSFNSVQFRFVFESDGFGNTYDGWMIDDFSITPPQIQHDAGIERILTPASYTTPGSSVSVKVRLKNYGTQVLTSIPLYYRIDNNTAVAAVWTGSLQPGASTDYTFASPYTATAKYKLKASTLLAGDTYTFNNADSILMNKDVALSYIFLPRNKEIVGDSMHVAVSLQNFGTDTLFSLNLEYEWGNTTRTGNWTGVLPPGGSAIYYFPDYFKVKYGIVNLCARVVLQGDTKASNNETCKYISGVIGIEDAGEQDFVLYQNHPNPFSEYTIIRYKIPVRTEINYRIMDIYGRLIKSGTSIAHKGTNILKVDNAHLKTGVYFFEIEYNEQLRRIKMIYVK